MFQDLATTQENYDRFINRVLDSGEVWGIQHEDGSWATSESNEYEDTLIYVFWSDKAYAQRHCKEQWSSSRPSKIELDSFIDCWLKGMHEDGHLVGPNWDAHFLEKKLSLLKLLNGLQHKQLTRRCTGRQFRRRKRAWGNAGRFGGRTANPITIAIW